MEFKTLKDLKFNINEKDKDMKELMDIIQDQEAIKWVKKMKSDIPEGYTPQRIKDIINGVNGGINILKKFCNIDEEDLK
ncbi:MAG: hypothetical protein IIA87_03470 [Nanoarchaeota archaeon]|nr:hypothetical protein [Nanoarchaeota archaeon]